MTLASLIRMSNYVKEVVEDTKVLFGLRKHSNNFYNSSGVPYHLTPEESTAMARSPTLYKQICEGL